MTDTGGQGPGPDREWGSWGVPGSDDSASRGQGQPPPGPAPGGYGAPTPPPGAPPGRYGAPPPPGPAGYPPNTPPPVGGPPPGPGWGNAAPEDLMRLHKPGVVPLRPLTLGDIFDGALATMRRNPESTIGLALIVLAIFLLPSIGLGLAAQNLNLAAEDAMVVVALLPRLGSLLATLALSGLIIYVVSEAVLGDRAGIGQTWRAVRGRIPALIGVSLLSLLIYGIAFVGLALVMTLLVVALAQLGALMAIIGVLAAIPAALWLVARLALASSAVVLEKCGPLAALGRSWALTRGSQAWRIAGILLLSWILVTIFSLVIATPLQFGALFGLEQLGMDTDVAAVPSILVSEGISLLVESVATPFTAGVTALLYLDQRMRRESLDISLLQAAAARASQRRS